MTPSSTTEMLNHCVSLHPKMIDLSLERMYRLLKALEDPHHRLPKVIHIAGTNGKGSTLAFLRAILESAGFLVHAYTSPHLISFHERIRLAHPGGGRIISEDECLFWLKYAENANNGAPITLFEITTAAAFLAFANHPADYLLLEVGLGGRLDATNVISPHLSLITRIDYDHQAYLGETLEAIAREKAGIFRTGVPALVGHQYSSSVITTLEECADRSKTPLRLFGRDWQAFSENGGLVFEQEDRLLELPLPSLYGSFQADNAGLAVAAALALQEKSIDPHALVEGLKKAQWPARMQRLPWTSEWGLSEHSEIWLDGGHNPSAGQRISEAFARQKAKTGLPLYMICGMLNTKDAQGYFQPFSGHVLEVLTLSIPGEANSFSAEDLAFLAEKAGLLASPMTSFEEALLELRAKTQAPLCLLVCGSLYLSGWILKKYGHDLA